MGGRTLRYRTIYWLFSRAARCQCANTLIFKPPHLYSTCGCRRTIMPPGDDRLPCDKPLVLLMMVASRSVYKRTVADKNAQQYQNGNRIRDC